MAEPQYSSDTFPADGLMQADYTYVGQATSTNMDDVEYTVHDSTVE